MTNDGVTRAGAEAMVFEAIADARERHRRFASWHEAYAVILEELDEFWVSVKADEPDIGELAQVAACCILAITELTSEGVAG